MKIPQVARIVLAAVAALTMCCGMEPMGGQTPHSQNMPASQTSSASSVALDPQCVDDTKIADFADAHAIFRPAPTFPKKDLNESSEGWVQFSYTISSDGTVRDIVVLDLIGADSIATSARTALATWRFSPATRRGVPIDKFGVRLFVTYRFDGSDAEAHMSTHDTVIGRYNEARRLLAQKKFDKAIATLQFPHGLRLNLYEQTMVSFVLALVYAGKQDGPRSLYHLRHATIEQAFFLDKTLAAAAVEMLVEAEAAYGNLKGALCAYDELKRVAPASAAAGTRSAAIVAQIGRALKDPAAVVVGGELASVFGDAQEAGWRHAMLRRKFSFATIAGEVKEFHLVCQTTVLDAPVDGETLWTVPPDAGACTLTVRGAPGAKFKLIEEQ